MQFIGRSGDEVLFTLDDKAVLISESKNLVLAVDLAEPLVASFFPEGDQSLPTSIPYELAVSATTDLDIKVFSNNDRLYTIPKSVQAEAKRGLEWRKEEDRGGTSVGLNTARTLARGGQIGIRKIRHIAKYFPRHEVDKKGTGYKPGEKSYPSNGRIAWALWGGDAAKSWATAIVERENRKAQNNAITASFDFIMSEYEDPTKPQLDSFIEAEILSEELAPQFFMRIRMDGSGIDRLYKVTKDGLVFVWDDAMWEDLGNINHDFETYDRSLDDPYDNVDKLHVPIDMQTAIAVSGLFESDPFRAISIDKINPQESRMMAENVDGVEWELVDEVSQDYLDEYGYEEFYDDSLTAAGEGGLESTKPSTTPVTNQDGNYTPAERSKKASSQVRDKSGQFAKAGGKVVIGGNPAYSGTIQSMDGATQTVKVKLNNGTVVDVPGNTTQDAETFVPIPQTQSAISTKNLTTGILGEPRVPIDRPVATAPQRLPQLTRNQTETVLTDWAPWAGDIRASAPTADASKPPAPDMAGNYKSPNAYNDPSLRKFLEQKATRPDGTTYYPNAIWYRPDIAKGVDASKIDSYKDTKDLTPSPGKDMAQAPAWMTARPSALTKGQASTPTPKAAPAPAAPKTQTQPVTNKTLANGVVQSGTEREPIFTKMINGSPVNTNKDGEPIKGVYVEIPEEGYKLGKVVVKQGESSNALNDKGELGTPTKTYEKDYDGVREYKSSDGTVFYGRKGVVVPKGKRMDKDGNIVEKTVSASALIAAAEPEVKLTPETSDVPPIYMAIVSPDDAQAVMDLIALIPATSESLVPTTFKRSPGKWVQDAGYLNDLNSPTPPPVSVLDDETLAMVLEQIDSAAQTASGYISDSVLVAIMAAGGVDRNKGNAEELRRYWLSGEGAAKIRWNTPGDWTRCVRQLSKYMGPRAKGYCALRHKEATGMWTGDKENRQKAGMKSSAFSTDFIRSSEAVIDSAVLRARASEARSRITGITADASTEETQGLEFFIPLVIPEGIPSGDGRQFNKGAITMRELPLPLLWQIKTGEGHSGSVVVGKITHMERTDDGIGNAKGYFDTGEYGKEAERLVRGGFIRGVSADMDMFEANEETNASEKDSDTKVGGGKMKITQARVMAVTLVPKPAFQECKIVLASEMVADQEDTEVIQDGVYVEGVNPLDASALVACGMVAGAIPVTPPTEWFSNPKLNKPTALTVTDDGKVFGHIAAWHVDHIGMAFGTRPPRSKSNYAYFHTGVCRTEEGTDVPVGQLTLAGGHAGLEASAQEAVKHYDDTASAVADVQAGEDAYGIWVSGALRPGTTPEQIRSLRASAPSGDWRPIKGALELVAVCQVNVPGFPIARARVASGQVMALVAAGANVLAQLKHDPLRELNERMDKLEAPLVASANAAKEKMQSLTAAIKAEELSTKIRSMRDEDSAYMLQVMDDTDAELAVINRKQRMKLAEEGKALPNGSFPIRNASDLRNAVQAYGRSKPGQRGKVRRHIMKMARQLDKTDLIPENWTEAIKASGDNSASAIVESMTSAGGADRNRGNAETLRRYWTRGEGAAKIRWGQKGDWSRCVRHLSKYMGNRAKGYCQLRHKEALGMYTATHAKMHKQRKSFAEIEETLGSFITEVTEQDMAKDIEQIHSEPDDMFDGAWEPETQIIILLEDGNGMDDESFASFAAAEITDADLEGLTDEEVKIVEDELKAKKASEAEKSKYTPKTQPRDASGKFRQVLARLKVNLGTAGSDAALKKIEETENLDNAGNYAGAAKAAGDLLSIVDRLDTQALNPDSLENIRTSAGELGKVIANLPFAFGEDAEKIRFSDIPPALKTLMKDMITRVEDKIGKEDAAIATQELKSFMAGGDYYNQSEISSKMSKLLRLLT